MTDKEKIRAEIERLKKEKEALPYSDDEYTVGRLNGYYLALDEVLLFILHLPEESVNIDFEQELYNHFGQVKDFTTGMRIAKYFYDMGRKSKEPVSEDLE